MNIDEVEVYITSDGLGRAAIVRRADAHYCIYKWIKLPPGYMPKVFAETEPARWEHSETPQALYADKEPLRGVYGTIDDARREVRSLPGFDGASMARNA
jgi:hypothetical protein